MIALLLVGAGGVYAVGVYIGKTPEAQKIPSPLRRDSQSTEHSKPSNQATGHQKSSAVVLTPKSKGGDVSFDATTEDVPEGTDAMVFAVNRYLENSHIVPSGAKAIGAEIKGGVAYIDCTEAMDKTYGSSDEMTLLKGLGKTLAQFPGVTKMQFLVSGKPISSFGNVSLDSPVDVVDKDDSTTKSGESSTTPGA
jgi:hypothetical protein